MVSDGAELDQAAEQGGLWDLEELLEARTPGSLGQCERMLQESVAEAARLGRITKTDLGLLGAALAGARSIDVAMRLPGLKGGYLVAQLMTPYRETCQALGIPEAAPPDGADPPAPPNGQGDGPDWLSEHFGTAE